MGQCQTIVPKITTEGTWRGFGYSMFLDHDISKYTQSNSELSPGWHLFIHDIRENFTGKKIRFLFAYIHQLNRKLLLRHRNQYADIGSRRIHVHKSERGNRNQVDGTTFQKKSVRQQVHQRWLTQCRAMRGAMLLASSDRANKVSWTVDDGFGCAVVQ